MDLKRSATGHIDPTQEWQVKCVDGSEVYIKMGGGENSFAHKHILAPSSQAGVSDDTKMLRRLWHRVDKGGVHADNPDKGAKGQGKGIMGRGAKYGTAMSMKTASGKAKAKTDIKNSAICLSLSPLDTVLVDIAKALKAWDGAAPRVAVVFTTPCVKTIDLAGNVTGPVGNIEIEAHKVANGFEVTHLWPGA